MAAVRRNKARRSALHAGSPCFAEKWTEDVLCTQHFYHIQYALGFRMQNKHFICNSAPRCPITMEGSELQANFLSERLFLCLTIVITARYKADNGRGTSMDGHFPLGSSHRG